MPDADSKGSQMAEKESSLEKLIDAKFETVQAELRAVQKSLDDFTRDIRKMLDDHETRLREQAKMDESQGKEITDLKVKLAETRADVAEVKAKLEAREEKSLDFWQRVAFEAIRVAALGAGGGGAIMGIARLMGVF